MSLSNNLLVNLFPWRLREGISPRENFLAEAFVHVLRCNADLRANWLASSLGKTVDAESVQISTRASYLDRNTASTIYPDIEVRGRFADCEDFRLIVEIKWDSRYDEGQIEKYDNLSQGNDKNFLFFLCARHQDFHRSQKYLAKFSEYRSFLWENIFEFLVRNANDCVLTRELVGFMEHHGLTPGQPISREMVDGYLLGRNLIARFQRYCERMRTGFDWPCLPSIFREATEVTNQYGRVAIVMGPTWHGAITLGFLHDNGDHKVPFEDGSSRGVDLMMRIESSPHAKGREATLDILKEKAPFVRASGGAVLLAGDRANRNANTMFIAQRRVSDFLHHSDEDSQLFEMHAQFTDWISVLFNDGRLERKLAYMHRNNMDL